MGNTQQQNCNYIKVEFLTKQEKKDKEEAIKELDQKIQDEENKDDEICIVPNYESEYKCSFRQTIEIPKEKKSISFQEIKDFFAFKGKKYSQANIQCKLYNSLRAIFNPFLQYIEKYQDLADFYYQNVHSYELYIDGKKIKENKPIDLEICLYKTPLFEVVYQKRPKFDRFMRKAAVGSRKLLQKIKDFLTFRWLRNMIQSDFVSWMDSMRILFGDEIKEESLKLLIPFYPLLRRSPQLVQFVMRTPAYQRMQNNIVQSGESVKGYMGFNNKK